MCFGLLALEFWLFALAEISSRRAVLTSFIYSSDLQPADESVALKTTTTWIMVDRKKEISLCIRHHYFCLSYD